MEILQTIWTALTTPNEGLMNILLIPLHFLDAFISMLLFTTILNIKTTTKQKILYITVFGLFSNIVNFIVTPSFVVFVNMIAWPLMVYFILKTTVLKSILSEVIALVTTSVLEFLFSTLLINIFKVDYSSLMFVPIYRLLAILLIYFTMFLITKIIKYLKLNISVIDTMKTKTKVLIVSNIVLLVLFIAIQFYLVRFYSGSVPFLITLAGILVLVAYFIVSIYSLISTSKLITTENDLEGANLTIHTLRVLHDTVRTFKHDFDNIVNGIGGYVRDQDMAGLTKYYEQLQQDCNKTNNLYTLSPDVINHPAIYNLLATKYYTADELNVQINLDIFLDLNEIEKYMKIYEFTRILGILLDNAIEAAKECNEKLINVIFRKEANKHRLVVVIENTYNNKDVDTDKIFEKGVSSKTDKGNTGLGLWKVRQILKKNNNLNLFTSKTKDLFKQQFEIYY